MLWMILVTHSSQFMGEMSLHLLSSLLFIPRHLLLLLCFTQPPVPSHHLSPLPLLHFLSPQLLPLTLNAIGVLEKSGLQSNGLFHSAISRSGIQHQLFPLHLKRIVTLMILWTSSMRTQPLPLSPPLIGSLSNALMQIHGTRPVRRR
jgi:hypothetical protein